MKSFKLTIILVLVSIVSVLAQVKKTKLVVCKITDVDAYTYMVKTLKHQKYHLVKMEQTKCGYPINYYTFTWSK